MDSPGDGDDEPAEEDTVTEESPDDGGTLASGPDGSATDRRPEEPSTEAVSDEHVPAVGDEQLSGDTDVSEDDPTEKSPGEESDNPQTGPASGTVDTWTGSHDEFPRAGASETTGTQSVDTDSNRARATGTDESSGRDPHPEPDERSELATFAFDIVSSVLAVLVVGALLFAVSGVWPPMVAVESPSMTPHMQTGDLVFVMDENRFAAQGATVGVVTARTGSHVKYHKFDRPGDVIVYNPDGNENRTPIIHRAMFWVDNGENWYEKADKQAIGRYSECGETTQEALPNCPAPHGGFVTKGDANGVYDQAQGTTGLSTPVKPAWVIGTAELRVPLLGCIRLRTEGCLTLSTMLALAQFPAGETTSTKHNRTRRKPGNAGQSATSKLPQRDGFRAAGRLHAVASFE
jgi:signal peptidase